MFKINHDIPFYDNNYITPSYLLNKQNYLPKKKYNLYANNTTQLFLIYRELLRILNAIKRYINNANILIEDDLAQQLKFLELDYPTVREKYATYCSTIANLLYTDITFNDDVIQTIYQNYKDKVIFTTYATSIINNVASFINSRLERYNYLVDILNRYLNESYQHLAFCNNYITEDYLTFVENNIIVYRNA